MQSSPPNADAVREGVAQPPEVGATVKTSSMGLEYFLRFLVVVCGIILGGIAALVIGLFTGWIPFSC